MEVENKKSTENSFLTKKEKFYIQRKKYEIPPLYIKFPVIGYADYCRRINKNFRNIKES